MPDSTIRFYVGGYAARGENGVLRCAFDGARLWTEAACDELENPSWLLAHPARPLLYAVEELTPEGRLTTLEDRGGRLHKLGSLPTNGADPCHISMSPDARFLFVSNYTSGSLAVFALDGDGLPARRTDFRQHVLPRDPDSASRPGRDPVRQEAPHVHFSLCDGERVYVNDLGLDQLFIYAWDASAGRLGDAPEAVEFPAGAGPRHLAFGADEASLYVLCELSAEIHVLRRRSDAGWRRVQTVSMVPEDFRVAPEFAQTTGAAIHFADARTLCASTRGHDSLAIFDVAADGTLSGRRVLPSGGKTPRDFLPTGAFLFAANQDSDSVQVFCRDGAGYARTGLALAAKRPTCLCEAAAR